MTEMTPLEVAVKLDKMISGLDDDGCAFLDNDDYGFLELAASLLRKIASGEYAEVVRCSECEYWQNDGIHNYGMCKYPYIGNVKTDTDYCSYGTKKEVDDA